MISTLPTAPKIGRDDVVTHRALSIAFLEIGQADEAEKHQISAPILKPVDTYALLLLGNITVQLRKREEIGEQQYRKVARRWSN
jgi:hypothetical protein